MMKGVPSSWFLVPGERKNDDFPLLLGTKNKEPGTNFMRVKALIIGTVMLAMPLSAWGANSNVGTSGAQFLKIGAGARPTGMGEAFVGVADDVNAVYYNPAGLGYMKNPELIAMHTQWFQDTNYEFGAFAYPSKVGTFGISAATLKTEDLQQRNADESYVGTFDTVDAAYTISYGYAFSKAYSLGANIRFIEQEIGSASAQTWSGDVGGIYKLSRLPLSLGMAVRHFGQEVKFNEEGDPQPLTVDVGLGSQLLNEKLVLALSAKKPRDNDVQYGVGSEWNQPVGESVRFALRAGYNTAGQDTGGTNGFSLGGGFGLKRLNIDVAWVPFGDLGDTMRYSLHFKF
jgi:hypothetical protein